MIHLHGGGYSGGRKNSQALQLLYRLASQGWVCVSATYPAFQPGFEEVDTSVTAVIGLNGYYGHYYGDPDEERIPSSPLAYVHPDAPPFFVTHGDQDTVAFVEVARQFVEKLRSTSRNPVVYAELPGAQHSFDLFHSMRFEAVVGAVEAFAAWVRSRQASPADRASTVDSQSP